MDTDRIQVVIATPEGDEISMRDGEAGTWVYLPCTLADVQGARIPLDEQPEPDTELRLRCYVGQAPFIILGEPVVMRVFGVEHRILDVWLSITNGPDGQPVGDRKARYLAVRDRVQSLMLALGGETLAELLNELETKWAERLGAEVAA